MGVYGNIGVYVRVSKHISANSTHKNIYTPWNEQLTPCNLLVLWQEQTLFKLSFRSYKLPFKNMKPNIIILPELNIKFQVQANFWRLNPPWFIDVAAYYQRGCQGAERTRKLWWHRQRWLAYCQSLMGFWCNVSKKGGQKSRWIYIYIYLLRKNEEVQTFAGFLWIKKTYLSKLYNHMYTYIYI